MRLENVGVLPLTKPNTLWHLATFVIIRRNRYDHGRYKPSLGAIEHLVLCTHSCAIGPLGAAKPPLSSPQPRQACISIGLPPGLWDDFLLSISICTSSASLSGGPSCTTCNPRRNYAGITYYALLVSEIDLDLQNRCGAT